MDEVTGQNLRRGQAGLRNDKRRGKRLNYKLSIAVNCCYIYHTNHYSGVVKENAVSQ